MRRALGMFVVAGILAVPAPASAEPAPKPLPCLDPAGCPDIIVDPKAMKPKLEFEDFSENACEVREGSTRPGKRRLLRFAFSTPNIGRGDLIVGSPLLWPAHFYFALCHAHFHFREYADYRLWTVQGYQRWEELRAARPAALPEEVLADPAAPVPVDGHKQGYCLLDIERYGTGGSVVPKYLTCDSQGISRGWTDVYGHDLAGQYVDVTEVPAGTYVLEGEVNAERLYVESDYANNRAAVTVTIP